MGEGGTLMQTKFIEAHSAEGNWGKFAVCRFNGDEWARRSKVVGASLLSTVGWGPEHYLILDLQTGEGAIFRPGGYVKADLDKHAIWVCPLFEPFLEWLWQRQPFDYDRLPDEIDLSGVPLQLAGYRRPGPHGFVGYTDRDTVECACGDEFPDEDAWEAHKAGAA